MKALIVAVMIFAVFAERGTRPVKEPTIDIDEPKRTAERSKRSSSPGQAPKRAGAWLKPQ